MLAGYFVLELVLVVLSPSRTDEINNMLLQLSLELNQKEKQDEKDKQEVEKGKQVTTMLRKFRVEWKQLYPWLDSL